MQDDTVDHPLVLVLTEDQVVLDVVANDLEELGEMLRPRLPRHLADQPIERRGYVSIEMPDDGMIAIPILHALADHYSETVQPSLEVRLHRIGQGGHVSSLELTDPMHPDFAVSAACIVLSETVIDADIDDAVRRIEECLATNVRNAFERPGRSPSEHLADMRRWVVGETILPPEYLVASILPDRLVDTVVAAAVNMLHEVHASTMQSMDADPYADAPRPT